MVRSIMYVRKIKNTNFSKMLILKFNNLNLFYERIKILLDLL